MARDKRKKKKNKFLIQKIMKNVSNIFSNLKFQNGKLVNIYIYIQFIHKKVKETIFFSNIFSLLCFCSTFVYFHSTLFYILFIYFIFLAMRCSHLFFPPYSLLYRCASICLTITFIILFFILSEWYEKKNVATREYSTCISRLEKCNKIQEMKLCILKSKDKEHQNNKTSTKKKGIKIHINKNKK